MGRYDFGAQRDMRGTNTWKWDGEGKVCKYPFGCADTDYIPPQEVTDAVVKKAMQGNLAYGILPPRLLFLSPIQNFISPLSSSIEYYIIDIVM